MIKLSKKRLQENCLNYLQYVEYVVRRVRGTSAAPSVHVCTTAELIVKGKTGRKMDTRRSAGN